MHRTAARRLQMGSARRIWPFGRAKEELPPSYADFEESVDEREKDWAGSVEEQRRRLRQEEREPDEREKILAQTDRIVARGILKHTVPYQPQENVDDQIAECLRAVQGKDSLQPKGDEWFKTSLKNSDFKISFLSFVGRRLNHSVPNSRLHEMRTVEDVLKFYQQPVSNVTDFVALARRGKDSLAAGPIQKRLQSEKPLPENLVIIEDPVRFHPDDKEKIHGGVTAFPRSGARMMSERNKRLYRGFRAKTEWTDFKEKNFPVSVDEDDDSRWNDDRFDRALPNNSKYEPMKYWR